MIWSFTNKLIIMGGKILAKSMIGVIASFILLSSEGLRCIHEYRNRGLPRALLVAGLKGLILGLLPVIVSTFLPGLVALIGGIGHYAFSWLVDILMDGVLAMVDLT